MKKPAFRSALHHPTSLQLFLALFAIASLLLTGCNSRRFAQGAETNDAAAGTYQLTSVDGHTVPCTITHGGATLKISSGTLHLRADGTAESSIDLLSPNGKQIQKNVTASYSRTGDTFILNWKGAGQTKATLSGDHLTMTNEGMNFTYERQP